MKTSNLSHEQAQKIIETGKLPAEILNSSESLVAILTQSWCSDWAGLKASLTELEKDPASSNLSICIYEYDKSPIFKDFVSFKENTWANKLIPYVRIYKKGKLTREGNLYHSRDIAATLKL